jgi:hypothetical protein
MPIGRYRECTRVAALRAAGRPPPWAITASAANCADPANTSADIAIAPIAEKPAWTASTPKESETTLLASAYGVPARTPAQKDARGGLSWSSPGIRATPDPDHAIPGSVKSTTRTVARPPDSARGGVDDGARALTHPVSAVRTAQRADDQAAVTAARARVGAAKRGLGERGTPWWEQDSDARRERWTAALAELDPS